jgi:hypothetical protein
MKDMKDMTKTKEAEETTRVKAMEKEEIAGSGIMNGINDAKTKSIGHGARKDSAPWTQLRRTRIFDFAINGRPRIFSFRLRHPGRISG